MSDKNEKSERVNLNLLARFISAMNSDRGPNVEVMSRGVGMFQIVLYGKNGNLVFVGNFNDCHSYLYGIRDMVTAGG